MIKARKDNEDAVVGGWRRRGRGGGGGKREGVPDRLTDGWIAGTEFRERKGKAGQDNRQKGEEPTVCFPLEIIW